MRKLVFRGKKEDGTWVYGMIASGGSQIVTDDGSVHSVVQETLGQDTGLKSFRSQQPIFEGDVVKGKHYMNEGWHRIVGKVVYVSPSFCVDGIGKYDRIMRIPLDASFELLGRTIFDE